MKYEKKDVIPKDLRNDYNAKILSIIHLKPLPISKQTIYNGYTGIGGLSGINFNDYENFHSYTVAKKEVENGQFFTPHDTCEKIASLFPITENDIIADLTCGIGNFFNFLPNESNIYGCELDANAYNVCKVLYENANIENIDIRNYEPKIRFDYILGNPPFNLKFTVGTRSVISQNYYYEKAYETLNPLGVMAIIVPNTWLVDDLYYSNTRKDINEKFTFICQYQLSEKTFKQFGVDNFATKVIVFAKAAKSYESKPYSNEYVSYETAKVLISEFIAEKKKLKYELQNETLIGTNKKFQYLVKKYLFEIKQHKSISKYYGEAISYVSKLNDTMPQHLAQMRDSNAAAKEWEKIRVTEKKIIRKLKSILAKQDKKAKVDRNEWVRRKYDCKLIYTGKGSNDYKGARNIDLNNAVIHGLDVPNVAKKAFNRRLKDFAQINTDISKMQRCAKIDSFLNDFTFLNADNEICKFTAIQFNDLGFVLQRFASLLAWQQGTGKTAAIFAWAQYQMKYNNARNVVIESPALSISMTWANFLTIQKVPYIIISKISDIRKITKGQIVLLSKDITISKPEVKAKQYAKIHEKIETKRETKMCEISYANAKTEKEYLKKHLRKWVKLNSKKIAFAFDESDEICNISAKTTKACFAMFRDVKYKLLATGTPTRNRISEYYPQFALLTNNSVNMLCECKNVYEEVKTDNGYKILSSTNDYFNEPYPLRGGAKLFEKCFNPSKGSVFGIRKQNQDVFNENALNRLISRLVFVRTFKEIAGDKYTIENILCRQNNAERNVYNLIINELHRFIGNSSDRKTSMLRIVTQLRLLIDATSMPQTFEGYNSNELPNKAKEILSIVGKNNELISIGCTKLNAVTYYETWIKKEYPNRKVFIITGEPSFKKRQSIIKDFQLSENGILICTQQSLRSSVNIPKCNLVIVESLQWNIPKIMQWIFRCIRFDSKENTRVYIVNYENTIEMNLLALLMAKERLNEYAKTKEFKPQNDIFEKFGLDVDILEMLIEKEKDSKGNVKINWGSQNIVA